MFKYTAIAEFICDTLTNTCGADQLAKNTCAKAKAAADTATKGTGAQADKFNAVFGLITVSDYCVSFLSLY